MLAFPFTPFSLDLLGSLDRLKALNLAKQHAKLRCFSVLSMLHAHDKTVAALTLAGCLWSSHGMAVSDVCPAAHDVIISARTPEVDLYDAPTGKVAKVVAKVEFPPCTPITRISENMMLGVRIDGVEYWIPRGMVSYRFGAFYSTQCRTFLKLRAQDSGQTIAATRGLGLSCNPPENGSQARDRDARPPPVDSCENLAVRNKPCPDKKN